MKAVVYEMPNPETEFIERIAVDCMKHLSEEDREYLREHTDPAEYHFGYGTYIRNHYNLWECRLRKMGYMRADDLSWAIIERIISMVLESTASD